MKFMRWDENTRVKFPATAHFLRLGYKHQSLKDAEIDFETKIFINRFKPALEKINNREFEAEEIASILSEINSLIKNNDLGKAFYNWLILPQDRIKLIDFDNLENNDFAVVDELPFSPKEDTEEGSFRPDINILINGMPLAFLEVKKPNNEGGIQKEFDRMINKRFVNPDYKKYFNLIQIITFSNNMDYEDDDNSIAEDVKVGSFYTTPNGQNTTFSFFREDDQNYYANYKFKEYDVETLEQVLTDEGYDPAEIETEEFQTNLLVSSPINRFITSLFDKERFMYFLQYGLMYLTEIKKVNGEEMPIPQKHIMRYPQFFATRKIIERIDNGGRGGIIWHTQGSGKTALAAYSNRIIYDYYAKKGITAKFFFIVDRLDLMTQAATEFKYRNLNVINCNTKDELGKELRKNLSASIGDSIGDICVVNIQRFPELEDMPTATNDYGVNVQRIFFVDEAHRSYAKGNGEFYKKLMTCDDGGIYIAMTGTPLLTKKERSDLRFGDYIHKYFYDKSIADGYTLRIKKENIDTVAKSEIKQNLDIENQNLESKDVFESDDYVEGVSKYIEKDFKNFRFVNTDDSIGGMIVCRTNPQARKIHEWFEHNSSLKTGLVMSDSEDPKQASINKTNQLDFRENGTPDILVVHYMLTTGYDVKRLKKMYLLRGPKAQSLLQTISRVNRPYKSPTTHKTYRYGYIVDFVDIEKEYNHTLEAYIKELEDEINTNGEEEGSLSGLIIDKEDIQKKYQSLLAELLGIIQIDNVELFSKMLTYLNKDALLKIRKLLNGIKDCRTEFELSRADEYANQIDKEKTKNLLKAVQLRVDLLNLQTKSIDTLGIMNNKDVIDIIYEFIKTRVYVLNLADFDYTSEEVTSLQTAITELQDEIKKNKNKDDIKIKKLEELLQSVFERLSISNLDNLDEITGELKEAAKETKRINNENERLSEIYGGHYSFVKTFSDAIVDYEVDKSEIEKLLVLTYEDIKDKLKGETILIQGKKNFVQQIKANVTKELLKIGLYKKVKTFYDEVLNNLYTNIQLFK